MSLLNNVIVSPHSKPPFPLTTLGKVFKGFSKETQNQFNTTTTSEQEISTSFSSIV
jgi:hypothetical protein